MNTADLSQPKSTFIIENKKEIFRVLYIFIVSQEVLHGVGLNKTCRQCCSLIVSVTNGVNMLKPYLTFTHPMWNNLRINFSFKLRHRRSLTELQEEVAGETDGSV